MKLFYTLLFSMLAFTPVVWKTNFDDAKIEAEKSHKLILVNFSGSDWCLPCIQLKKKIFETEVFNSYTDSALVLVNADFPRQNKHKLSPQQKKLNESLAEKYNKDGKFPFTILIDTDGKVLKEWDGLPDVPPQQFVDEIKQAANAKR